MYDDKKNTTIMIKKILKGLLLWSTAILFVTWLVSLESLIEQDSPTLMLGLFTIVIIFAVIIWETFSFRDIVMLSGYKWFYKLLHHEKVHC